MSSPIENFETKQTTQDWDNEAVICKAFGIGKTEARAVAQLHSCVLPAVREDLESAVRLHGLRAFITHDVIARETFSRGWNSATPGLEAWAANLTNGPNKGGPLVARSNELLC